MSQKITLSRFFLLVQFSRQTEGILHSSPPRVFFYLGSENALMKKKFQHLFLTPGFFGRIVNVTSGTLGGRLNRS